MKEIHIDLLDEQEPVQRQPISPGVQSSLAAAKIDPRDRATAVIAIRYAQLLDECAVEKQYAKPLEMIGQAIASVADSMMNPTAADQLLAAFKKIESALAEHSTASDLGPKLLATLAALNLTPSAREKGASKQSGQGGDVKDMPNPLQLLRGGAAERNRGA